MKKPNGWDMLLFLWLLCSILLYTGIPFFTGIGPAPLAAALLLMSAGCSVQLLALRLIRNPQLSYLPVCLALLLAVWGCWLYCTSPSWQYATLSGLLSGYVSPLTGTLLAIAGGAFQKRRRKETR